MFSIGCEGMGLGYERSWFDLKMALSKRASIQCSNGKPKAEKIGYQFSYTVNSKILRANFPG